MDSKEVNIKSIPSDVNIKRVLLQFLPDVLAELVYEYTFYWIDVKELDESYTLRRYMKTSMSTKETMLV